MFLSDRRPCPNYVSNNSESGPTEGAHTKLGFRGSYLSFRLRLAVFWQAQLGWCWAELLPREKNLFFFFFSSRHTGAGEYWSHSIKSGHMGVNYSSSEASLCAFASLGYCSPDLQYLMFPIFDAAAPQQLGQSWCVWRRRDSFVWMQRLKDRGKNNQANLSFNIAKNCKLAFRSCIFPRDTHYHLLTSKDGPLPWL